MKTLLHAGVVYAFCACVAGCAVPEVSSVTTSAVTPANTISAHDARDAVTIGKSTKADVIAALGKTTVISFDSGFEVWVYQIKNDTPAKVSWWERIGRADPNKETLGKTEFVVLFAPSGVVTKTRVRPAPPPSETERH
jgi:outer membrane protein assembly factor BamE (lipoprotein component of BamABCDE complex)